MTTNEEQYYVVGGADAVNTKINDRLVYSSVEGEPFDEQADADLKTVVTHQMDRTETPRNLVGTGALLESDKDAINPYYIVGGIPAAPTITSVSATSVRSDSVVLKVIATGSTTLTITVSNGSDVIATAVNVTPDAVTDVAISGLTASTKTTLSLVASDTIGNKSEAKTVTFTTTAAA